jgi:hypothetical protein
MRTNRATRFATNQGGIISGQDVAIRDDGKTPQMNLQTTFPNASQSFIDANPSDAVQGNVERIKGKRGGPAISMSGEPYWSEGKRGRKGMNKTESEFAMRLEAMKRKGEILRFEFEGITLRFAGVKYTPDFVVFGVLYGHDNDGVQKMQKCKFIEVKGPFIKGNRERAVERFRHAKTYWPEFTFEMMQKTRDGWKQII